MSAQAGQLILVVCCLRSCDTSRQTSTGSLEYDDDFLGYLDPFGDADSQVNSEECLMRDDVLPSPTISPRLWAALDEARYVDDSDDSVNVSDDQSVKSKKGFRRHRVSVVRSPRRSHCHSSKLGDIENA
ncbi:hypothetical protein BsWGS_12144 [Bradybaena similaris]